MKKTTKSQRTPFSCHYTIHRNRNEVSEEKVQEESVPGDIEQNSAADVNDKPLDIINPVETNSTPKKAIVAFSSDTPKRLIPATPLARPTTAARKRRRSSWTGAVAMTPFKELTLEIVSTDRKEVNGDADISKQLIDVQEQIAPDTTMPSQQLSSPVVTHDAPLLANAIYKDDMREFGREEKIRRIIDWMREDSVVYEAVKDEVKLREGQENIIEQAVLKNEKLPNMLANGKAKKPGMMARIFGRRLV